MQYCFLIVHPGICNGIYTGTDGFNFGMLVYEGIKIPVYYAFYELRYILKFSVKKLVLFGFFNNKLAF